MLKQLLIPLGSFRYWFANRRSALNTIKKYKQVCINKPATLIDCGCNNSQWSQYLIKEWPSLNLFSIDLQDDVKPLGQFIRAALSNEDGLDVGVHKDGTGSHIIQGNELKTSKLDTLFGGAELNYPLIIKYDCETHTLNALQGSIKILQKASLVHVEVANTIYSNSFMDIVKVMQGCGFANVFICDAIAWYHNIDYIDVVFYK
jgi:hypothetical protein